MVSAAGGGDTVASATLSALQRIPLQPAELAAAKSMVCVTGATGFIAGPIIERLLRAGHTVHATCRDPSNLLALSPLLALPGAAERLRFFKADLAQAGSFDAAVKGCKFVVHVAAPVLVSQVKRGEGRSKVVEPMMQGVDNVLGAVNRTESVRRVVMTSSICALCCFSFGPSPGRAYGTADWNTIATDTFRPYMCGKTVSEQRAWELAGQQSRWDLVTVLPSIVFGPAVGQCANSESVQAVRDQMWSGRNYPATGDMGTSIVDVRDVAAAHCLAMVTPGANGRYIVHAHDSSVFQSTHVVAARFPGFRPSLFHLPFWLVWLLAPLASLSRDLVRAMWGKPPKFNTDRTVQDLGMTPWIPLGDTFEDMINDMAYKGVIKMR